MLPSSDMGLMGRPHHKKVKYFKEKHTQKFKKTESRLMWIWLSCGTIFLSIKGPAVQWIDHHRSLFMQFLSLSLSNIISQGRKDVPCIKCTFGQSQLDQSPPWRRIFDKPRHSERREKVIFQSSLYFPFSVFPVFFLLSIPETSFTFYDPIKRDLPWASKLSLVWSRVFSRVCANSE